MYTIRLDSSNFVALQGPSSSGYLLTQAAGNPEPASMSKVVFHKYGEHYFLGEIWIAQKSGHMNLIKSDAEKRMQRRPVNAEAAGVALAMLGTAR